MTRVIKRASAKLDEVLVTAGLFPMFVFLAAGVPTSEIIGFITAVAYGAASYIRAKRDGSVSMDEFTHLLKFTYAVITLATLYLGVGL